MNIFTNEELLADISGLNKTIDHLTAELSQVKAERDRMREEVGRYFCLDADDIRSLIGFCGGNEPDKDDISEIYLTVGELQNDDGSMDYGLRAFLAEYPEEGGIMVCKLVPEGK